MREHLVIIAVPDHLESIEQTRGSDWVAHVLLNVGDTHCRGGPERIAMCRCGSGVGSGRPLVCRMVKDDQNSRLPSSQNLGHPATLPAGSPLNHRHTALSGHCLPPAGLCSFARGGTQIVRIIGSYRAKSLRVVMVWSVSAVCCKTAKRSEARPAGGFEERL